MAFRLPHGVKDPLRQTLLSQNTGVGPGGVASDGFDHGGAFADAFCILCGRFPRDSNHGKPEQQQGLHDRAVSNQCMIRADHLRATSGFDRSAVERKHGFRDASGGPLEKAQRANYDSNDDIAKNLGREERKPMH